MTTRIIGTGSYLPKKVVTNDDLAKIMETSDEWIRTRTGIKARHLVQEETTTYMCVEAAKRALENANMQAEDIDLILVGTITGDHVTPSTACEIQAAIGADKAVAFDINAACSGFLFALHTAHAFIQSGIYQNALILGAETLSKIMDWNDRSTCVLFGDGAGAAVVRADETGLIAFEQGSDGSKGQVLACENRKNNNPYVSNDKEYDYVHMDGQEVYKFAVSTVPKSIHHVLEKAENPAGRDVITSNEESKAGLTTDDITYYVLHQANIRIIQSVAKRLKVEESKFPISLDHCGNISAASVPILLDEMNRQGLLKRGDKIIMSGFGAGLTWGTALLEW